jgi:pyruvate kinase
MRRTRVVATIGPSSWDSENLSALFDAGADVFRLNYSHGEPEHKTKLYEKIRSLETSERTTCILADLPGPKLRLGEFPGVRLAKNGDNLRLLCGVAHHDGPEIPVEYDGLSAELNVGDSVLLADGLIRLSVTATGGERGSFVDCIVEDGGPLTSRKGVNVPGTTIDLPAIGPKDEKALAHALEAGADWIAVSYVRTAEDLRPAKEAVKAAGKHTPIIAKIEHPSALTNLHSILDVADGVMVARGDLGVEIPLEHVPLAQQTIIDAGLMRGMVVIVATQMLESMTLNPRPTRAEVSDVSTAIRHGGTAVMLSGETASGNHPVATVETMVRIVVATEAGLVTSGGTPGALSKFRSTRAVAHASVELAKMSGARHILVATQHGNAPRLVAGYRPDVVVTAVTDRIRAARRMNLLPGVESVIVEEHDRGSQTMQEAIRMLAASGSIKSGERIVAISGSPLAMRGATSTVRLYRLEPDGTISGTE